VVKGFNGVKLPHTFSLLGSLLLLEVLLLLLAKLA
jgi:hypothetical protein